MSANRERRSSGLIYFRLNSEWLDMMNATESGQLCFGSIKAAVVSCLIENHKSMDSNLGPERCDCKHQKACAVCIIS